VVCSQFSQRMQFLGHPHSWEHYGSADTQTVALPQMGNGRQQSSRYVRPSVRAGKDKNNPQYSTMSIVSLTYFETVQKRKNRWI